MISFKSLFENTKVDVPDQRLMCQIKTLSCCYYPIVLKLLAKVHFLLKANQFLVMVQEF